MLYTIALSTILAFSQPEYETDLCGLSSVICSYEDQEFIKRYIIQEFNKNGLDGQIGASVAMCESYLDPSESYVNDNGTTDRGLWMLNNYWHKEVSDECAYDYKCSTAVAIEIVKKWGNFNAWYCYRNKLIK
jgi:hypothetical protein